MSTRKQLKYQLKQNFLIIFTQYESLVIELEQKEDTDIRGNTFLHRYAENCEEKLQLLLLWL